MNMERLWKKKKKYRPVSGKVKVKYGEKKHKGKRCRVCGITLQGVAGGRKSKLKKFSKSEKRPSRVFAGVLCSGCCALAVEEKVKQKYFGKKGEEMPFELKQYVEVLKRV